MGRDDIFKKKKAARKSRREGTLSPRANSFLIVTEGAETEPLYFEGLASKIRNKVGGCLFVDGMPQIDIEGEGCGTRALIRRAEEIVSRANIYYQNVWLVFDKDDFTDFNQAILEAESKGYNVAWSNQSFEYWLFLHFEYSDAALHREEWNSKLSKNFHANGLGDGSYRKNYGDIYNMLDSIGSVDIAIKNAKRRMSEFYGDNKIKPSNFDPGTTVYLLVDKLREFLDE